MDSPINRMIDSVQSRTPAVSKNIEKNKKSLNQKVVELVASANRTALPDRQVVPRNALVVMARAMKELSSLPDESREAGVIREVNKFISLNQNTFRSIDTYGKHTDLLPAGHPLSDHNASLSTEDYLKRYASWLSADPGISDDVRHLVAAAYSQLPGSLEREHAFARLNAVKASALPAYFKIDISALVAAFSFGDGNSSAARRARVKLQWRDRFGKWIEMGRGVNFKARLSNGNVVTVAGTYVGSDSNAGYSGNWARKEANAGLVEVKGDVNIPDGIYSVSNSNAESFKARLSESELERAGVDTPKKSKYKLSSQFDESIPDLNDLLATKVDGPSGWTKNEDGSFTSDDDYKVIKKDDGYEVYRLDPEGKTGDKVGDAKTWADVQNVAAADEEAYDKYKEDVESGQLPLGDGERPEPRYSRMNRQVQEEIRQLKGQIPQNQESNQRIESQLERALSGKDSQGRDIPEGWYSEIDPSQFSETYYKDIPGATRKDERLVAVVGSEGKINYGTGGFWFNNAKPTESWDQITEDTPKIIDQINASRARIGLDPIGSSELGDFTQLSKKDYQNIRSKVDSTRNRLYTQDGFAFSRNETGFGGYDDSIVVTTEDWEPGDPEIAKIESDGGIDWSNDAMYDTWADSLRRAISTGSPTDQISDKEIFDRRMAGESLQEVADSLGIPREEVRAREAKYARENPPAGEGDGLDERIERYIVDFETLGSSDMFDGIPELEDEDPTEMSEEEALSMWLEAKGLDKLGVKIVETSEEGLTKRVTFDIPAKAKDAFGQAYGLDLDENLGDGIDKVTPEGPDETSSDTPGGGFADYVIDLAEGDSDLGKDLEEEYLDGDAEEAGEELVDKIYEDASDRYDLAEDIRDNKPSDMSNDQFIKDAVARMRVQLSNIVDAAIDERQQDDDSDEVDFDRDAFIEAGANKFAELLKNELDNMDDEDEGPDEPPTLWGSTNSIKKPDGKTYDILLAEMDETDDSGKTMMQSIVDEANKLGIHVELSPEQTGLGFGDERVARFTFPEKTVSPELAKKLIGSDPDSGDGILLSRIDNQEDWDEAFKDITGDGPDEPPTPPSGGTPPKSPAPSSPAAPALFREFDVPAGAFNLRTVEYEPEGRVDEASTDFTDAPNRLAVRFPLDTLVRAFTRSLIGDVDENVIEDIVDINDDGDGNLPDLSEVGDVLENNLPINVPRGERPRASGAGTLEFNAGDEFVPAEALYNAVWLAGGDPNRVIANAYDAVNGNRNNLSKLLEAQGGVPTPEEEKLIVDIIDEIRQIDDVTPEEEKPVTNADTSVDEDDLGFPGGLIENVPVDFDNPDYHDMDLSPYISTILEPDELGYTDNPKYIAIMVKSSSDLIQQMKSGITDGTGAALVRFNDDSTSEVPVEAIRDALQYQGINTNDILFKLRDESNDMSNDEEVQSDLEIDSQEETAGVALDYPGPRKKGYSVENTTLDLNGNVIGEGSFITAVTDGKTGIILKIQDSPAYARIQFDDGTVVVRSANKIFAIANKDGSSPAKPSQDVAPVEIQREPSDITERLEAPATKAPLIARTGDVYGVNDVDSKIPDEIKDLTQKDIAQTTFSEWGTRDAEIAKAANTKVKLDELEKAIREVAAAREGRDREKLKEAQDRLNLIANDIYGGRQGISFGAEYYTLKLQAAQAFGYGTAEEILSGSKNAGLEVSFSVLNQSGVTVGSTRRTLTFSVTNNVDGTVSKVAIPSNNYMEITRDNNQKKGFASGYNRYMENWYVANGIEKVEVYAAVGDKYEGGFVWALNGFGWDPKRARIEIKDAINNLNRKAQTKYEIKWAEYLTDMAKNAYDPNTQTYDLSLAPTPMQIALAGWKEGSENWLGRKVMLDTGWHGVKNLIPSAREQVQAVNYRRLKNAEKRVQSGQNKTNVSSKTLSYLSSNDFQVKHPELGKSVDMIRNVIRNNESLAVLSNADKVKLNNLVSAEMLDKNSKIPVDDINKIRTALIAEYKADNVTTDPFAEVGEVLTKFTLQQFTDKKDVQDAGFEIKALSTEEGKGVNSTWRITHKNSGQIFYVKNDAKTREYMEEYGSGGAATSLSEIEASVLLNSSGLLGTHFTRVSTTDENILIMSSAGATIPTYTSPISARDMENYGLTTPAGGKFFNDDSTTTVNTLKSPEDVFRIHILDTILSNQDRHTGNWQVAFDTNDDKLLIFPIDNTYTYLDTSVDAGLVAMSQFLDNTYDSSLYKDTIPNIVLRAEKNRVYEIYKKEVQRIIDNIDNPITAPKENEMTFLISKWGSYDAFKDSIKQRLNALVEDGTEINTMLRDVLSYRGRRD